MLRDDLVDYDYGDNFTGDFEENFSFNPARLDSSTFKQRNDPSELIFRFKLQLMNAFIVEVEEKDEETGRIKKIKKVKIKKGTEPKANKEGIEDIISYLERYINNHIVQSNIPSIEEYNDRMLFISQDINTHFLANRKKWGVSIAFIDILIRTSVSLVDLFLTRALFNEERKGYGEAYKETTSKSFTNDEKPNVLQKFGSFLSGGKYK